MGWRANILLATILAYGVVCGAKSKAWPAGVHRQIIVNLSGYCYDLKGNKAINAKCSPKKLSQYFNYKGSTIKSHARGNRCLKVAKAKRGQKVVVGTCSGNHRWRVEYGKHGYRIRLLHGKNQCIDVPGTGPKKTVQLIIWNCESKLKSDHWVRPGMGLRITRGAKRNIYAVSHYECHQVCRKGCVGLNSCGLPMVWCKLIKGSKQGVCYPNTADKKQVLYRGTKSKTKSGRTCQKWTDQSPHKHTRTPAKYKGKGLGKHNYCRNPDNSKVGAWCYTVDGKKRWESCGVPFCADGGLQQTKSGWPAGYTQIVVRQSKWCYDLYGNHAMNMKCNSKKSTQYWYYHGNSIRSPARKNKCLKVNQAKAHQKVYVGSCKGYYKWQIKKGSHGYRIRLLHGKKNQCIDIPGWAPKHNAQISTYPCEKKKKSDHWVRPGAVRRSVVSKIVKAKVVKGIWPSGHGQIVVKLSKWCYDVSGSKAMNKQCNPGKSTQFWQYYKNTIRNPAKGHKCLRAKKAKAGQKLYLGACSGNYKWKIEKGKYGFRVRLLHGKKNQCVDVPGTGPKKNVQIILWTCEKVAKSDHWVQPGAFKRPSVATKPILGSGNVILLSYKKSAIQSSTGWDGVAARALDGNPDGYYKRKSVSHTAKAKNNWWKVDLGKKYHINMVSVYNRLDAGSKRIDGAAVYAGTYRCGIIRYHPKRRVYSVPCNGKSSRYVTVKNTHHYLQLAEVEVFGGAKAISGLTLLSHKQTTKQSSTGWKGVSGRAVDGNVDGYWTSSTTTHSKAKKNNWWYVDLGKQYPVYLVVVHNRWDKCCSSRINGVQVYVGKHKCGTISYISGRHIYPVNCGGKKGRKVKLVHKTNYLTLVEVQVFGTGKALPKPPNFGAKYTKHAGKGFATSNLKNQQYMLPGGPLLPGSVLVFKGALKNMKKPAALNLITGAGNVRL